MTEQPRDVFLSACDEIAKAITPHGFTYAKSGPHLTKKYKDLKFKITFSSSYNNIAGHFIAIRVYAHIDSLALKKFRSQFHRNNNSSQIAVQDVSTIPPRPIVSEWNLADPSARSSIIQEITSRIEELAIPFFNSFETPEVIANKLVSQYVPYIHDMKRVITYLLFYSSNEMAKKSIEEALKRNPDLIAPYKEAMNTFSGEKDLANIKVYGFAEDMAYYSLVMGWGSLA